MIIKKYHTNKIMEEVFNFLKEKTKVNFVSTINGDKPSNRPFGDPVLFNNRIYVLTMATKNVAKQIEKNNNVCIVAYDNTDETWIRINCKLIDDSENIEAKQAIINEFDWAEESGYTLDNPNFKALYMSNVEAIIYDIDGNELSTHKF
ncbi:MAG: pyridoxamine 5-phosphate oxidase [Clostridia bacterium]|nr:pyridoxamine 5-phosphate oxidase [Clostridia bacterium]